MQRTSGLDVFVCMCVCLQCFTQMRSYICGMCCSETYFLKGTEGLGDLPCQNKPASCHLNTIQYFAALLFIDVLAGSWGCLEPFSLINNGARNIPGHASLQKCFCRAGA